MSHWPLWLGATAWLLALFACGHALLLKRDPRAAWGWIVVCVMLPFGGVLLYFLFGINRVETRAHRLRPPRHTLGRGVGLDHERDARHRRSVSHERPAVPASFEQLARTADVITHRPLLDGNLVEPLHDGEQAYPHMLQAIAQARESVLMASYIFDVDKVGEQFIAALADAQQRGLKVCVLVDGFAELSLSRPCASRRLRQVGVDVQRFHPPRLLPPSLHLNLRNHRKLLIVDGELAYTGGMNISLRHMAQDPENNRPEHDLHFELRGPVVQQLAEVFGEDWRYAGGGDCPCPAQPPSEVEGGAICRVITDGPNEDLGQLTLILLSALASARSRVRIMTPYFLPPRELVAAMEAAVLRGVQIQILLPSKSDQGKMLRAMRHQLPHLILRGLRLYYQPPPFVHSKLLIVDDEYVLLGSANLDPRSLRLNFELVVEAYDRDFALRMARHFKELRKRSTLLHAKALQKRPLPSRLYDAVWWLFSPYL
ncbi:phospholipase D-like domain-containing protein [Solimonas sp. SE-A11]|uniref:phospholipase D-like domain-containing protein n=1 Tax=Solimonas sp. SE-A11 TaxID=3054954 RepID=UPI00259CB0B9|nr:phospholipase D-like domain-containing protein [Solimonas sp. SE-A11]MDM4773082.1 phospholipase D-like domain-containing protein [Solimonas sp. SE-A11]